MSLLTHTAAHILVILCSIPTVCFAQDRRFTVKDDIEMMRFNDPSASVPHAMPTFSPDEKHFVVITSRGLIKSNEIESVLWIFDLREVRQYLDKREGRPAPKPRMIAKFVAVPRSVVLRPYAPIVTDLRWAANSRSLYFLVQDSHGIHRLYQLDVSGGTPQPLTPTDRDVRQYDFGSDTVVYSASPSKGHSRIKTGAIDALDIPNAIPVKGMAIEEILFPRSTDGPQLSEVWMVRGGRSHPIVGEGERDDQRDISSVSGAFAISPKGRMLIRVVPVAQVPTSWKSYESARGAEHMRIANNASKLTSPYNWNRLKQYSLTNLDNGREQPLIAAPYGRTLGYVDSTQAVWSQDERRVLVTNTFLPLEGATPDENSRRHVPCAIADVQVRSLQVHCIIFNAEKASFAPMNRSLLSVSFGKDSDEVVLRVGGREGDVETKHYRYAQGTWLLFESTSMNVTTLKSDRINAKEDMPNQSLEVTVEQSLNEPPTLWCADKDSGDKRQLWDPNPQLGSVTFGHALVYRWKDRTGHEWTGGLVQPVGYSPGMRYPLVIQVYNFMDDQFITDGNFPTAMAARPLASAGIAVLQVQRNSLHPMVGQDADDHLEGFTSAVDQLTAQGVVDPHRVGLVGFSWTCWYVENALIKEPTRFAAATIADGPDHSYMQYHLWGISNSAIEAQAERINGSKPLKDGLKTWIDVAPGFNLDRIKAPLRIEAIKPRSLLGEWEIYSSLVQQGRPVDLIYFPEGQHIHQTPMERMASQQGDVDWFRFWLTGYVDPDPMKAVQYRRWEVMRQSQEPEDAHCDVEPCALVPR